MTSVFKKMEYVQKKWGVSVLMKHIYTGLEEWKLSLERSSGWVTKWVLDVSFRLPDLALLPAGALFTTFT